ncbi:hypothetical protein ES319_D12G087100v1 [Gossypium barbadense]|uniref:phosphoribosyl-ATP diphosphatase n=1 Tax=Gossypium barbadense TaxID=3634 RepID=A0A5J5NYJ3_GOSBA|nr:hypothetical protein ES319_D12G087100v1 [Gossypium barbadense]
MAISSLPCIQPVRVPFKVCSFFLAGVCGGFNNKKMINAVVFSSLRKISNDIYIESKPDGPTCHTGSETCYFTSIGDLFKEQEVEETNLALTTLYSLEATISKRELELAGKHGKPSWTKRLLLDENLLCSKIREEADELCRMLEEKKDSSCIASKMADVIYHAMVLLRRKDVKIENVLEVLRRRFSQSGIEEKQSRASTES